MERLLQLILERVEQIQQFLFARRGSSDTQPVQVNLPSKITIQEPVRVISDTGSFVSGEVEVTNTPLPVSISGQPISTTITNSPLTVGYSSVQYRTISASSSGDTEVVPAVSGKRIRVIAYAVVASGTVDIKFRSATTDITGSMHLVGGGGVAHAYDGGLFQTSVGQALNINLSANATVGGYVVYREV
jgi:hypothetical protein